VDDILGAAAAKKAVRDALNMYQVGRPGGGGAAAAAAASGGSGAWGRGGRHGGVGGGMGAWGLGGSQLHPCASPNPHATPSSTAPHPATPCQEHYVPKKLRTTFA
jgi:hypothetical protein